MLSDPHPLPAVPDGRTTVKVLYKEYYIRRMGPRTYQVTKFVNGSDAPLEYYDLVETPLGYKCNCQGGVSTRPYKCKHVWLVDELKRQEVEFHGDIDLIYPLYHLEGRS